MKTQVLNKEELVIDRIIDAPKALVWKAWSEPEFFSRWFGPKGFTIPSCEMDFRVGGRLHFAMRSPEGKDFWGVGEYKDIVEEERIVYTDHFANQDGDIVPATYYGMSDSFPIEMEVRVTFENYPGIGLETTRMTLKHENLAGISDKDRSDMKQGWTESFEKLEDELMSMQTGEWEQRGSKSSSEGPGSEDI